MPELKLPPTALRALMFAALVIGAVAVGMIDGFGTALLVLAGGTLLVSISLFWSSIQDLSGESELTLDEALGMAAPSAEEERKRSVLRALKDLEYERSVGKISEEDFAELSGRYRQEAKRLLQALDEHQSALREKAESALARRLRERELAAGKNRRAQEAAVAAEAEAEDAADEPEEEPEAKPAPAPAPRAASPATAVRPTRRCAACEQRNDLDAQFCKRCGGAMAGKDQALCVACPAVYAAKLDACPDCGVARPAAEATAEDEGEGRRDDASESDEEDEREAT